jgi:hypothetical protein
MTTAELKAWAGIGDRRLNELVAGHGLQPLPSRRAVRYSVSQVFRILLGLAPACPHDVTLLLKPLRTVSWVSRVTGHGVSTLGRHARGTAPIEGFPMPIQLSPSAAPETDLRDRRWLPAEIEALLQGKPDPFERLRIDAPAVAAPDTDPPARNVLEQIAMENRPRNDPAPPQ